MKKTLIAFLTFFSVVFVASGQQMYNFTLKDTDNNLRTFQELKGEQITLIDFWTTWCKPCKKSIPELNKIYKSYQEQGVQVIGVNCDGPRSISKVAPMSHALQIRYPVLLDINSDLMNNLNLANFPTLVLVDAEGEIAWIHEGFVAGDEELIVGEIEKRLSESN